MYYDSMQPEGIKEFQKCDFPDFENYLEFINSLSKINK